MLIKAECSVLYLTLLQIFCGCKVSPECFLLTNFWVQIFQKFRQVCLVNPPNCVCGKMFYKITLILYFSTNSKSFTTDRICYTFYSKSNSTEQLVFPNHILLCLSAYQHMIMCMKHVAQLCTIAWVKTRTAELLKIPLPYWQLKTVNGMG